MKRIKTKFLIFLMFWGIASACFAQDTSTQGTEFWVSFMSNGHKHHPGAPNDGNWIQTQVLISSKNDCEGTITNPQTGWNVNFTVRANNITTVEIPEAEAYIDQTSERVVNTGIRINSTDTVSVFCTNIAYLSFDASYVLPIQSLADDYIIQTYDQSSSQGQPYVKQNQTSAFLIVATENNTVVDIVPTVETFEGRQPGQSFSVTLNKGQAFQVRSNNDSNSRDLSGSRVTAHDNKPIAVFNGNTLTTIPLNGTSFDHIFEQAMPLQSWGKKFVATCSLEREKDYVKVTSASDNNIILKNGQPIVTLQSRESYIFELPEPNGNERSCFIETSGRSAVYLYHTKQGGNSIGDPSVVWIAPIEQRIDDITFSTFNNENIGIERHHVNIIVSNNDVNNVYLDGNLLPASSFENVAGSSEFSFTRQNINHGVHHLQCEHGFNAHVYGFGIAKGYAYMVGSKTIDLTTKVFMNEEFVPKLSTYDFCSDENIVFLADVNLNQYDLQWEFGDGSTSTTNPATHTYAEKRVYEVTLTVNAYGKASEVSKYYVDTRIETFTETAEVCIGNTYNEHGFNVIITNDTLLGTVVDNEIHPVCKDSLLIYVTALPGYYAAYDETRCWFGQPETYTEHGFNFVYDHAGEYNQQIVAPDPAGCDSIIDLHLVVADRIINPDTLVHNECSTSYTWNGVTYTESGIHDQVFTSAAGCDSIVSLLLSLTATVEGGTDSIAGGCHAYLWHGQYYNEPGYYTDTIQNALGCDSIVHLQLSMTLAPHPSEIHSADPLNITPHWMITATEFEIKSYVFTLWDNNEGNVWDSVVWSFESVIPWKLEPYGEVNEFCEVLPTVRLADTVWLNAKVYNSCDPGVGIERRYWLISSFYGLDDQEESMQVDIVPNPNKGEMTLIFGKTEGPVTTKVYDMTGQLVDQFELQVGPNSRHSYSINDYSSGIYLFIFNDKGKSFTRRVVVTK